MKLRELPGGRLATLAASGLVLALAVFAALSGDDPWERTPHPAPPRTIPLDSGPGGPILVILDPERPFGSYLTEILRNEGLNAFGSVSIDDVTPGLLRAHRVAILSRMDLDRSRVSMLEQWVEDGGNLVAIRPDDELLPSLGLSRVGSGEGGGYLRIDTDSRFGAGLVPETIQFHGNFDLHRAESAAVVAQLYGDRSTSAGYPAVTIREGDGTRGDVAAFVFDLPWSIVMTRQGNPEWQAQERDGIEPKRSNDLFYGASESDPQPDWVDMQRISIPQADEHQRLLANLLVRMTGDDLPLPRFWYFPSFHRAVVLMTGDHHGCCGNTVQRFERYLEQSPSECSIPDWECVRASAYVYLRDDLEEVDVEYWHEQGFELGVHVDTNCEDWDPDELDKRYFGPQLQRFGLLARALPGQASMRTHCIAWSDWATQARVLARHGIRLDTNYYFWPPDWVDDKPGHFTGSAMPMRFVDLDGSMIDVYQATTQMTDESGQSYPRTIEVLLDRALGEEGHFGVFTANMHMDNYPHPDSDAIVEAARARGVPVVSGRQLVEWIDGRNLSAFGGINRDQDSYSFSVMQAAGARNLRGMIPVVSNGRRPATLHRDSIEIPFEMHEIKGIEYMVFEARSGDYRVSYDSGSE